MGIYKIDNVSSEEWHRRKMRRYHIKMLCLTAVEILLIAAVVVGMWFLYVWASDQIHP